LLKKRVGEEPKQNTTNFIFINHSGIGEVPILSMPDLYLLFTCTLSAIKNDEDVTALAKHQGGRDSDVRLCMTRQTQDVKIGRDCSFAKTTAFTSDNHGSFGYAIKNGGPVLQQVWHIKESHC
jgi:hypothetical protein